MALDLTDVKRIASLARLELTGDELNRTADDLNNILGLIEALRQADTAGVEPLSHPAAAFFEEVSLRLRDDAVTEENRREDYQAVAPSTADGLYLVPKVIE